MCINISYYKYFLIDGIINLSWNLMKKQTLKLRTMQRAHETIMLNTTWRDHKTAEWIRQQTKNQGHSRNHQ